MTILFVCTGNTCRSPMAVAAWRALDESASVSGENIFEAEILSAGLAARDGSPMSKNAREVAFGWGVSMNQHEARVLSADLVRRADLICPMTQEQAWHIVRSFSPRVPVMPLARYERSGLDEDELRLRALLGAEDGASLDIPDPYGAPADIYREYGARIRRCVKGLRSVLGEGRLTP